MTLFVQPIIHHRPLRNAKIATMRYSDHCGAGLVEANQEHKEICVIVAEKPTMVASVVTENNSVSIAIDQTALSQVLDFASVQAQF